MSKPETVDLRGRTLPGLVAVGLFVVLTAVFVTAQIGDPTGFSGDGSITASIGYAMFDLTGLAAYSSERFLVAFIIIAVVLDAALDGSVMLAKRDEASEKMAALTDGGLPFGSGDGEADRPTSADGGDD
jgi:NADH-quinone oxidoreductase subunit J